MPRRATPVFELVPGIEISAVAEGRDVHVLGYFIDTASPPLRAFLERQREDRVRRVAEMGERLAALGCPIDVAPIVADAGRGRSVGRPQIAAALLDAGHVRTRDEAFDRFLEFGGAAYVSRCGTSPEDVVAIIHAAGGIASLAHPGVNARDHLIAPLAAAGLDAIEARALGPRRGRPRRATARSRRISACCHGRFGFSRRWRTPRLAARRDLAHGGGVRSIVGRGGAPEVVSLRSAIRLQETQEFRRIFSF